MQPIKHPSSDLTLGPAKGDEDTVQVLHATRVALVHDETKHVAAQCIVTYWQPDAADLVLLGQGRPLRLSVMGGKHPPVWIGVEGDGTMEHVDRPTAAPTIQNHDLRLDQALDVNDVPIGKLASDALDLVKSRNPALGAMVILYDPLGGLNCTMDNLDTPGMSRKMLLMALEADLAAVGAGPGPGEVH